MEGRLTVEEGDVWDMVRLFKAGSPWDRGGGALKPGRAVAAFGAVKYRLDRINSARRSRSRM